MTVRLCRVCRRELRDPASVASGVGPECRKKELGGYGKKRRKPKGPSWDQPGLFEAPGMADVVDTD